jgi:hypothetical protein
VKIILLKKIGVIAGKKDAFLVVVVVIMIIVRNAIISEQINGD